MFIFSILILFNNKLSDLAIYLGVFVHQLVPGFADVSCRLTHIYMGAPINVSSCISSTKIITM